MGKLNAILRVEGKESFSSNRAPYQSQDQLELPALQSKEKVARTKVPLRYASWAGSAVVTHKEEGGRTMKEEIEPMLQKLMETRHLTLETLKHYDVQADLEKKAWKYPADGGCRYKAFSSNNTNKYWSDPGLKNQLYGLTDIEPNTDTIYFLNGEPAVWAAWQDQIPAFCAFGESNFPDGGIDQIKALNPGEVAIIADSDNAGIAASRKRKELLAAAGFKVRALKLPAELGDKADYADLHNRYGGNAEAAKEALAKLEELGDLVTPRPTEAKTEGVRNERMWKLIKPHLDKLTPGASGEWSCICPFHGDTKPSLSVNPSKGVFQCFGCGETGTLSKLAEKLNIEHKAEAKAQVSTYATATELYEEVVQEGQAKFAYLSGASVEYAEQVEVEGKTLLPISAENEAIIKSAVVFPSQAEEYDSLEGLRAELRQHIHYYLDIAPEDEVFCIHYILLSWLYDRFSAIPYLGFRGDFGTGKSRALEVIGKLCYKPCEIAGAVTPAPIYRLIEHFKGTLLIEEANFRDSTEANEVVKILNCGFEKNKPISRCVKEHPDEIQFFDPFCPKVVTTRSSFDDKALESRFYTIILKGSDRVDNEEIPYTLGDKFKEEQGRLRNKLLRFRLDNYFKVSAKNIEDVRLPNIEPRLKQAFSPFIILLQDELEALAGLEQFLQTYNQRLVKERADSLEGRIIEKVFGLAEKNRKDYISASDILKELGDEAETLSVQKVGRRLSALGIETGEPKLKPGADKKRRHIIWDDKLMRRLKAKYIPGE